MINYFSMSIAPNYHHHYYCHYPYDTLTVNLFVSRCVCHNFLSDHFTYIINIHLHWGWSGNIYGGDVQPRRLWPEWEAWEDWVYPGGWEETFKGCSIIVAQLVKVWQTHIAPLIDQLYSIGFKYFIIMFANQLSCQPWVNVIEKKY